MGRKKVNTIKVTVSLHPSLVKEVREYAKQRTIEQLKKEVEFGKHPLKIWQFVPCKFVDGDWVVLEEKHDCDCGGNTEFCSGCKFVDMEYQQAKERCLFEGFHYNSHGYVTDGVFKFDEEYMENKTIEDLVKHNLELTPTAQKQIGL